MTTVTAEELFRDVALTLGWDPDNLSTREWTDIRDAVSHALKYAWEWAFWPDLMRKYKTAFRPSWSQAYITAYATYPYDTILYDPFSQAYYQALVTTATRPTSWNSTTKEWEFVPGVWHPCPNTEPTDSWDADATYVLGDVVTLDENTYVAMGAVSAGEANSPALNSTLWHRLLDFTYSYSHTGWTGREPVGLTQSVTLDDPEGKRNAEDVRFDVFTDKTVAYCPRNPIVWVKYRMNCPKIVGAAFDASATYTVAPTDQQINGENPSLSAPVAPPSGYGVDEFSHGDPTGTRSVYTWYFDLDTGNQWVWDMVSWSQIVGT